MRTIFWWKKEKNWWKSGRLGDPVVGGEEGELGRGEKKRRVGERARKDGDGQCRLVYQSCIVEESLPFSTLLLCWLHPTAPTARSFLSSALFFSPPSSLFLPVARPTARRHDSGRRGGPSSSACPRSRSAVISFKKAIVLDRKKERKKERKREGRKEGRKERVEFILYLEKERDRSNRIFPFALLPSQKLN